MKTADLQGPLLDYYVAKAEGLEVSPLPVVEVKGWDGAWRAYKPSTFWSDGGPLIEKYKLDIESPDYAHSPWVVSIYCSKRHARLYGHGDTPLQAICRAVVRAAFGDEVEEVLPC